MVSSSRFFHNENNTGLIIFFIVVVLTMMPYGFIIQIGEGWHYFQVYSAIWVFRDWSDASGGSNSLFNIPDLYAIPSSLFMAFFSYLLAIQIVRHHQGKTTKQKVRVTALLTLVPLLPLFILSLLGISMQAGGGLTGPIPIFVISGLVIDYYWGVEASVSPWNEDNIEID